MMFLATPFALIYGLRCWRRAPRQATAFAATLLALLEAAGMAWILIRTFFP